MRTTLRLSDDLSSHVDDVRHDDDTSHAEAVRECVRRSQRLTEAEARVDEFETEVDRLRREKRQILAERNKKAELARYAEDQRSAEQRRREASLAERARWFVFGMSDESDEA